MIKSWQLANFKSVSDETRLQFAPLTVFAGANSSGKSTIIQSILLTAQTLQSSVVSRPVVLNGHIARLGAFPDIVSDAREEDSVTIGFELEPRASTAEGIREGRMIRGGRTINPFVHFEFAGTLECSFRFGTREARQEREIARLQPVLEETRLKVVDFALDEDDNARQVQEEIVVHRASLTPLDRAIGLQLDPKTLPAQILSALAYEIERAPNAPVAITRRRWATGGDERHVGAGLVHFLPNRVAVVFDSVEAEVTRLTELLTSPRVTSVAVRRAEYAKASEALGPDVWRILRQELETMLRITEAGALAPRVQSLIDQFETAPSLERYLSVYRSLPAPVLAPYAQRLGERLDELKSAIRAGRTKQYEAQLQPLTDLLDTGVDVIQAFFGVSLKYLGPLRDEPKPVYPLAGSTDPADVGYRGEYTAAVLEVHRRTEVEYIPPHVYANPAAPRVAVTATLFDAVLDWLVYMGVGRRIRTIDRGKLGHELKIATADSDTLQDLTQVGVGVSQVLPILVLSLLAESGSTLIFEQPELHLHPRVQTRLADFFVSLTDVGKQCILETHSEYLINRLRYQAAVSEGSRVSDSVIMYFVEKESGKSVYRPVRINEFGVIPDWPKGFFDENEENAAAILRAGLEKRRRGGADDGPRRP